MTSLDKLLAQSIPELRERFVDRARPVPKGLIEALETDKRQGAHHLAKQIRERWRKSRAEVGEIDTLNIYHAGLLAMQRAVNGLSSCPDFVLVDARRIPHCSAPQRGIIKGDTLSASIAAASIIAKTTRDALMREFDSIHPGYNFATHKGYPTPEHCRLLKELGAAPIHRRSFARVREVLALDPIQTELFAEPIEEQSTSAHG